MKRVKFLLISLLFILLIPHVVYASKAEPTCSDIRNKYNEYQGVVDEYISLSCDTVADQVTYDKCVNLVHQKNGKLQDLYSYTEKNSSCSIGEVDTILEVNRDHCSNTLSSDIKDFASTVMNFFYMIAPFLLILFGSIDFFKMVVNGDPKSIKQNRTNFFKRVIAFILLYFTPYFVNLILSITVYDVKNSNYICISEVSAPVAGESETRIIYSGIYGIDNSLNIGSSDILTAADSITKTWASQKYDYSVDTLVYGDIKKSIDSPYKTTCCATLVAAALYKSNLVTEQEINAIGYNGAKYIALLLDSKGWSVIDSYDNLKPGDIVFMTTGSDVPVTLSNGRTYNEGHVQIYASPTKWYNAGSVEAIRGSQPSYQSDAYARGRFSFAMRAPARGNVGGSTRTRNTNSSSSPSTTTNTNTNTNTNTSTSTSTTTTNGSSKDTINKDTTSSTTNSNTTGSTKKTITKDNKKSK